tara:strand:- start:1159 stop:2013 length:855 start_codon:yes stop_codon:yes gene_type:complete
MIKDTSIFAHPSELEFAQILNFYGLKWEYEPRSFALRYDGDKIAEMMTPDFYLTDLDLYLELTTLKQSLVTQKNRKVRKIKELYPDVNIKLLYRKDFHRILAKYGFGPLAEADTKGIDKILLSTRQIQHKVNRLGSEISSDYKGLKPVLVGVQRGMICFMADLMRKISLPVEIDFMTISPYSGDDSQSVGISKDLEMDLSGKDVILVEDIIDTGMTLSFLKDHLISKKTNSLQICTLLDKKIRRLVETDIKYVGFDVPDEFLVGYGLDYNEKYRNLPFIGILQT